MKSKFTNILIFVIFLMPIVLNLSLRGEMKEKDPKLTVGVKFENVQIINPDHVLKPIEYIKRVESSDMKTAMIINPDIVDNVSNNNNVPLMKKGMTERPNFLSSVIRGHATNVQTHTRMYGVGEGTPKFDLDEIKQMIKANSNPNMVNFIGDNTQQEVINGDGIPFINKINMNNPLNQSLPTNNNLQVTDIEIPLKNINDRNKSINNNNIPPQPFNPNQQLISASQLPNPMPIYVPEYPPINLNPINPMSGTPIPPITQSLINMNQNLTKESQKNYNLNIQYKGQENQLHNENNTILPDLSILEEKMKQIDKLSDQEMTLVITQLKNYESNLSKENEDIYKNIKKYEAQNNVILDSLKDDIHDAGKQLGGMIQEIPQDQRMIINREIEEQFSKSLSGYNINKAKFAHLRDIDPKELFDISNRIKQELDANDNFYLHGDFNFYN